MNHRSLTRRAAWVRLLSLPVFVASLCASFAAAALEAHTSNAGIVGRLSARWIASQSLPVNETEAISEHNSGGHTYGTLTTRGLAALRLLPDTERAVFDLNFRGVSSAPNLTTRVKPRIWVYTAARVALEAHKPIRLDGDGIFTQPARGYARTDLRLVGVKAPPLVRPFVIKQARKRLPQAAQDISVSARKKVAENLEQQASEPLRKANQFLNFSVKQPLADLGIHPQFRYQTTESEVVASARFADLNIPGALPILNPSHDLFVAGHESVIAHIAAKTLAGKTYKRDEFLALIEKISLGLLKPKISEGFDFNSVSFHQERPLTVAFDKERLALVLRVTHFVMGADEVTNLEISGKFKLEKTPEGPGLTQEGEFKVVPLGSNPISLEAYEKVSKSFSGKIAVTSPSAGLQLSQLKAESGWVSIAFSSTKSVERYEGENSVAYQIESPRSKIP